MVKEVNIIIHQGNTNENHTKILLHTHQEFKRLLMPTVGKDVK